MRTLKRLALLLALAPSLRAQPNVRPGTDVALSKMATMDRVARSGTYPDGTVALALETTSCNLGTVDVPWRGAMDPDHPFISFLLVRESGDRMVQISDRSHVKHGFFALSSSDCGLCPAPGDGTYLAVGCSDTYSVVNNGDNFWLGPADEVDPFLGLWEPVCSHFDRGFPPAPPPADCDGIRGAILPDVLGFRVLVPDSELATANSKFYFQGMYVVRGEALSDRDNNLGSREFVPTWNGSLWDITVPTGGRNQLRAGSVLTRWAGASVTSAANGPDDGVVYAGVKVIDLGNGLHRYEYALHNRDNARAVSTFRLPICAGASVQNVAFRDIDADPANDWTFTRVGSELVFSTSDNPLRWNTLYNFSFESDASPATGLTAVLHAFDPGPGRDAFPILTTAPLGPLSSVDLGFSHAGSNGLHPEFRSCGSLSTGSTGEFLLRLAPPGQRAFLLGGFTQAPTPLFGGTLVPFPLERVIPFATDGRGELRFQIAGGGGPLDVVMQFAILDPLQPTGWVFSNAALVTFDP